MHDNQRIRVTLIEPGMVDTPFFDKPLGPDNALHDSDIAAAVIYALSQPERVDVNEILIRPRPTQRAARASFERHHPGTDPPRATLVAWTPALPLRMSRPTSAGPVGASSSRVWPPGFDASPTTSI